MCGHATLASAHVLFTCLKYAGNEIIFSTLSGELKVTRTNDLITLDFPSSKAVLKKLIIDYFDR